jgi:anhydro-N-acetylmuramic acid kinase
MPNLAWSDPPMKKGLTRAIGLMSGTSCDGADAALLDTDGENEIRFYDGLTVPYEDELRNRILEASQHDVPIAELLRIEKEITSCHAVAVEELRRKHPNETTKATVVGFHGHTVRHAPSEGLTLQIGNPWQLSEAVGLPVVADFRRRDMALQGQGAPLVAMFHRSLFADEPRPTLVLNLGGVANVTWLGEDDEIIAGDTGPGCGLIDEWAQEMAGMRNDHDGQLALAGTVHEPTVAAAVKAPFFKKPLPKSADRYDFDHVDVSPLSVEDGAATLCAVTVRAVVEAVERLPEVPQSIWVTGGGVHHPMMMQLLRERFDEVQSVRKRKLNPDTLEAECFAWLAVRHLKGLPLTIPETTGCSAAVCGGVITC